MNSNFKKPTPQELIGPGKIPGDLAQEATKIGDLPDAAREELRKDGDLLAKSVERLTDILGRPR